MLFLVRRAREPRAKAKYCLVGGCESPSTALERSLLFLGRGHYDLMLER